MTHWHLVTTNGKNVVAVATYNDSTQSIVDYVAVSYDIFKHILEPDDRAIYLKNMDYLVQNDSEYKVYLSSDRLAVWWMDCNNKVCIVPQYN